MITPKNGWTIATLKEHFDALRVAEAEALRIQAKEYERRLEALNGEQARLADERASFVNREIWDRIQDEDRRWKTRVDLLIERGAGEKKGIFNAASALQTVILIIIAALTLLGGMGKL